MASEQFSLVLGCGGHSIDGMVLCASTYNIIIDFDRHFDALELQKIMDFLDFTCSLFDRPMGDWNKIINTIKMLREQFGLINDKTWKNLHMWLPLHKQCGAFLRLMFNADIDSILSPSQESLVEPAYLECPVPSPKPNPRPANKKKKPRKIPGFKAKKDST